MDVAQAKAIADALPNPPRSVAPSAAALLAPTYWDSIQSDLTILSACLNSLEEQDAVITCRKMANQLVLAQRDIILSRCKKIVAARSIWLEELDALRKDIDQDNKSRIPTSDSFCDKTMQRIASDQDQCVWHSEAVAVNGGSNLVLQLKITQSVAEVLDLPESFNGGNATLSSSLHVEGRAKDIIVFRATPLKRSGSWVSPNPIAKHSGRDGPPTSGAPDEDQILYYLRLYLSLGGERTASGEFLSESFVREVATLVATQQALFDLTQTSGAKFEISPSPISIDEISIPLQSRYSKWLQACKIAFPAEASAKRPAGKLNNSLHYNGIPLYDQMSIQLHDTSIFTWALKFCYGEVLKRASAGATGNDAYFVPPSVLAYVEEHVMSR